MDPITHPIHNSIIFSFDPGATTGFAAIGVTGKVIYTAAIQFGELERFLTTLQPMECEVEVVVEQSPSFGHHSPITRQAERIILDEYPNASRITPSQWKSHPRFRRRLKLANVTIHEQDAARLGKWYYMIGEKNGRFPT